jgi:hypothetical protein
MEKKTIKVSQEVLIAKFDEARASGQFFGLENVKRTTGELRLYKSVRGKVKVHTTGEGMKYDPKEKGLGVVWEALNEEGAKGKEAYRAIARESIKSVTWEGVRYELED